MIFVNINIENMCHSWMTATNIPRCWTYETSVALDQEIPNELPYNDYFEYFGPDFKLHIAPSNMANQNTGEYVDKIRSRLVQVKDLQMLVLLEFSLHYFDDEH